MGWDWYGFTWLYKIHSIEDMPILVLEVREVDGATPKLWTIVASYQGAMIFHHP